MAAYFDSCLIYLQSQTTLEAKLTALDDIIDALIVTAATAAETGNIQDYTLNDGQTTIKMAYRDAAAVSAAIDAFERIRQRYLNRLNGRIARGVDSKNFKHANRRY